MSFGFQVFIGVKEERVLEYRWDTDPTDAQIEEIVGSMDEFEYTDLIISSVKYLRDSKDSECVKYTDHPVKVYWFD